jgi:hypothetical protein
MVAAGAVRELTRRQSLPGWLTAAGEGNGAVSQREERADKALVFQGPFKLAVEDVEDPKIEQPGDAVIRITTANICGSDLHPYEGRAPVYVMLASDEASYVSGARVAVTSGKPIL